MRAAPHQPSMNHRPLALLAVAFCLGILLNHVIRNSIGLSLSSCAALSLLALIATIRNQTGAGTTLLTLALIFAGASLGELGNGRAGSAAVRQLLNDSVIRPGEPVELSGVIQSPPESGPQKLIFDLRVERIVIRGIEQATSGTVSLLAPLPTKAIASEYESLELQNGARLRVMTTLNRADSYRNPGVVRFTEYLDRKGYDATGLIRSPLLIERLDDERVFLPLAWLYAWRGIVQRQIDTHFPPETSGVLDAALLGNRYNLTAGSAERFRAAGTFHVLVISGLHISFIGGMVLLIIRQFTKKRILQFVLPAFVLWGYAIAVGAGASVVRAALTFTVIAFGPVVFRRGSSVNALGGAAIFLLVYRPGELFDPSFQLTFLSVLAIVLFAWPLLEKLSAIGRWRPTREMPFPPRCSRWLVILAECLFWSPKAWQAEMTESIHHYRLFKTPAALQLERYHLQRPLRFAFSAVLVSVCAQLTLLPLLVLYFHRLSLAALLLNVGVGLLMAAEAIVALIALLFSQFSGTMAAPFISITNSLNWLMVHSVDPFARLGLASLRIPQYSDWASLIYGLYYLPLGCVTIRLSRWNPFSLTPESKRKPVVVLVVLQLVFSLIVFHPGSSGTLDRKLHVDFLDVGQGDSALVTMPDGTTLLIDGGGRPDFSRGSNAETDRDEELFGHETRSIGEAVVSEYLWWRGLDHIDYLLATHADADHINGLCDVARNFQVRSALVARVPDSDAEFLRFAQTLRARGIPLTLIGRGDVLQFGKVKATVLWPLKSDDSAAPSQNNDSVVLRFDYGDRSILFTGDIESGAERALLEAKDNLHADVVKVAHHGSRTSSIEPFVRATGCGLAIISVGQTSIFGHPNPDVVQRWQAAGADVLTTGNSGTITITTDGSSLEKRTFAGSQ